MKHSLKTYIEHTLLLPYLMYSTRHGSPFLRVTQPQAGAWRHEIPSAYIFAVTRGDGNSG